MRRISGIQDINGNTNTLTQSLSWKGRGSQLDEGNTNLGPPKSPLKNIQVLEQVKLYFPQFRKGTYVKVHSADRCWSVKVPEVMSCECLVNILNGTVPSEHCLSR